MNNLPGSREFPETETPLLTISQSENDYKRFLNYTYENYD